jgi:osmotically-inducible protein OsmY
MAWKQLVGRVALGAGLGLGVAAPAWAQAEPIMNETTDVTSVQQAVQSKLSKATSTANQIEVHVDPSGVVKLTGFVESDTERSLAVQAAQGIPGVTEVHEDLRVLPRYSP